MSAGPFFSHIRGRDPNFAKLCSLIAQVTIRDGWAANSLADIGAQVAQGIPVTQHQDPMDFEPWPISATLASFTVDFWRSSVELWRIPDRLWPMTVELGSRNVVESGPKSAELDHAVPDSLTPTGPKVAETGYDLIEAALIWLSPPAFG